MLNFYQKRKSNYFRSTYVLVSPYFPVFRPRSFSLRSESDIKPFYIIGCGRSGTTLLRKLLLANDQVYIPPESYVLREMYYCFLRSRKLNWEDLVDVVVSKLVYHPEFFTFKHNDRVAETIQKLHQLPSSRRTFADLLNTLYISLAENHGRDDVKLWGDKTPLNTLALNELIDTFPNARFIHLIRDGRDVVNSYTTNGMKTLENSVDRWVSSMKLVNDFKSKHSASVIDVKYEDMVLNKDEEMIRICTFLGLASDPAFWNLNDVSLDMLGDVDAHSHHQNVIDRSRVTTSSVGKGKETWDPDSISDTANLELFNHYQKKYGYL